MRLTPFLKTAEKLFIDNSPAILTAVGVVGAVTTAVLTGKATYKYMAELAGEGYYDRDYRFDRSTKEHLEIAWKLYIPAVGTGVLTIAAIVGANRIGARRAAGLAAAYSLSERAYLEYKEKVVEKLGENKERDLRDELAQDRVNRSPEGAREIVIVGTDVLCHDAFSGRYFQSSMEALRKAENELNYQVLNNMYASLTDLYDLLGLPKTAYSDEVGWNVNNSLSLKFSSVLSEDGRPCLSFEFDTTHIRDYHKFG